MKAGRAAGGCGRLAAALAVAVGAAGCSVVEATPEQVTLQFNSYYPGWAFSQAGQHCGQFGREPVLVASRPGSPSWRTGFTGTTIQTFDCVAPTPRVAPGDTDAPGGAPAAGE